MRNCLFLCLALITGLLAPSFVMAQTNTPDANAPDPALHEKLQALVLSVQAKAQAGKQSEADYADELGKLDALILEKQAVNTNETAELTYMKAMLYLEVLKDLNKGGDLMGQIATNYPGTPYGINAASIVADIPQMREAEAKLAQAKAIQDKLVPGAVCPDFSETDLKGQPLSVASRKGKVLLLDFWATWCPPCMIELPYLIKTYQKHHGDGFEIIGVNLDSDRDKLDSFLKQTDGMTWPQYFDGQGWHNKLVVKYGVNLLPFTLLIGPDGRIIAKDLSGDDLEAAVAKALATK